MFGARKLARDEDAALYRGATTKAALVWRLLDRTWQVNLIWLRGQDLNL